MSRHFIDRRRFLTLSLFLLLGSAPGVRGQSQQREEAYDVDVGLLYNALRLELAGRVHEMVDRAAGRYEIRAEGEGARLSNRIVSQGIRRGGRWAPLRATAWFKVVGRESTSELIYDYERWTVHYRFRGETFFLRRLRLVDDTIAITEGLHVDDVMSAVLNYSDRVWPQGLDGTYRTHIVRRRRPDNEGADDVQRVYRAEIVPFALNVTPDPVTGKAGAVFDLTRFSSWARESQPGRVIFGPDSRPETVTAPLILGTSVSIRFKGAV
jgi:hypothetical protein